MAFWNLPLIGGVLVAIVLFFLGMKLLKWVMWALAILAILLAVYFGFF